MKMAVFLSKIWSALAMQGSLGKVGWVQQFPAGKIARVLPKGSCS